MDKNVRDNLLGKEKISIALLKLSAPATLAMFVNGLYNVVDTIFVGRVVGKDAIGALSIVFSFQMLVMAFGGLLGMGAASVISRSLGARDPRTAAATAGNAMLVSFVLSLLVMLVSLLLMEPMLKLFGASPVLLPPAIEYMAVIIIGVPFITFSMVGNNIARSEGQAKIAMISMLLGAILNIFLDPLFIYVFGLGIRGAAIATVISQGATFLFLIHFFSRKSSTLELNLAAFIPKTRILREIIILGLPAFLRQGGMSLIMILINNALGKYGEDIYISAYGVINRITIFVLMPLFGIAQGFQPLVGFNYGAHYLSRVKEALRTSILWSTLFACSCFLLMILFPAQLFGIFTTDQALIKAGVPVFRMLILIIPLIGVQIIGSSYFMAVGKAFPAFFLGLSRQFIFLLPLLIIFPLLYGLNGILVAFPLADFMASLVTIIWLAVEVRKLKIVPATAAEVLSS